MTETSALPKRRNVRGSDDGHRMLHIALFDWQVKLVDQEAAKLGLSRRAWIRALIGSWLRDLPRFSRDDELALFGAHAQARMMREELTSLRRALQEEDADTVVVLAKIEALHSALGQLMTDIRAGFAGNRRYWRGKP